MIRIALVVGLLLGGFLAGLAAMLVVLDRVFGGDGPTIELSPTHRELLDDGPIWRPLWYLAPTARGARAEAEFGAGLASDES